MAYANETLKKVVDKLYEIPDVFFDIQGDDLLFQSPTNATARRIRKLFPGAGWKRRYVKDLGWWEWNGKWEGIKIRIYAIHETPNECKAIIEKRTVTERVPSAYVEEEVEQDVIVGWDCGTGVATQ